MAEVKSNDWVVSSTPRKRTFAVSYQYTERSESHLLFYTQEEALKEYHTIKTNTYGLVEVALREQGQVIAHVLQPYMRGCGDSRRLA